LIIQAVTRIDLSAHHVLGLRANNPGPLTLSGTNSWLVGADQPWLIDPGPALPEHVGALTSELELRGGLAGVALTHDHADHAEALAALRHRWPDAPLAAARGRPDVPLRDGLTVGPLEAVAAPGHAPDHFAFVAGRVGFTGDAVLGEGSVFIAPGPSALAGYLEALAKLRARDLELLCPGHGPVIEAPRLRLTSYIEHRLERERQLTAALDGGQRSVEALLDAAWSDVPAAMRPAAAITLAAHLDKLEEEARLPHGVERPVVPPSLGAV
jgi:glyoxylase-like metal-dependent hydrolase (beta-lactamase superfamily II)